MTQGKSLTLEYAQQQYQETRLEADSRKKANFPGVEDKLLKRRSKPGLGWIDNITSLLGLSNPFAKQADRKELAVWLLDNTAYRPVHPYANEPQPWQAEFVACFFYNRRRDIDNFVSNIADQIGLDGKVGGNEDARKRIAERVKPFIEAIAPARSVEVSIPCTGGQAHLRTLGPANPNGISSQTILTGGGESADGTTIEITSALFLELKAHTRFTDVEGWTVVSDIDDTIKITGTPSPVGILQTTFADIPQTTPGIPDFYKTLNQKFKPSWFYLSASPYNLYPFLHKFINDKYTPGTIILRDASFMYIGGILQSLTQGTEAYKTDRMEKIFSWIPKRKLICIGDSTQTDPETYGVEYRKHPGWIKAIFIRKVTDADYPNMADKNKPERFTKAFKDVPSDVWQVFENPTELAEHVKRLGA